MPDTGYVKGREFEGPSKACDQCGNTLGENEANAGQGGALLCDFCFEDECYGEEA